jgi:O-antigen ligase
MRLHTAAAVVAALFLAVCMFGGTVALRLVLLAAGIIVAAIVLAKSRGSVHALPPIWVPFLAWGAWAALSLSWSRDPEHTIWEWRNEVFYTAAACWICYVAAQARHATRIFAAIGAAAVAIACTIALYEFSRGWERYLAGRHGGPGDHSSALLVLIPCVAMGGWYAVRTRRPRALVVALGALAVLMVASAYTTLNRTVWLGFALQFVLLGFLTLWRAGQKRLAFAATTAVVLACGAMALAVQAERSGVSANALHQDSRLALWPKVVEYIEARPLTGYGFGRGVLGARLQEDLGEVDHHLWHAHNIFLEVLLQLGVPGAALLLVLLGAIAREGWRAARDLDQAGAACGIALLAIVAGMLVRNMTDTLLVRQNALLFWGVTGLLLGTTLRTQMADAIRGGRRDVL